MFTYRFAEFVDDEPTGTFIETEAPSLPAAVIDVAGMEWLRDDGSVILADYYFLPSSYTVSFDNISYRLVYGPRGLDDCERCYAPLESHDGAWRCMNVLCRDFDKPL